MDKSTRAAIEQVVDDSKSPQELADRVSSAYGDHLVQAARQIAAERKGFPWLRAGARRSSEQFASEFHRVAMNPTLMDNFNLYWKEILIATFIIGGAIKIYGPIYADWSKAAAALEAKKEQELALEAIGVKASLAGQMLWSAYKACTRIGIQDLQACSQYKGILLQEQGAPVSARLAIEMRASYEADCQKVRSLDYCGQLLNRAWHLSQTDPES